MPACCPPGSIQTYERLDAELKQEEAAKDQLCSELNTLVQQAAKAQLDKLEELKVGSWGGESGGAGSGGARMGLWRGMRCEYDQCTTSGLV